MDALLLRILKHRDQYESLMPEIDTTTLHAKTYTVLRAFGEWFTSNTEAVINIEDFKVYFFNFLKPYDSEDKKRYYNKMLDNCKAEADASQTQFILEKLVAHNFATQVGNLVQQYSDDAEIDILEEIGIKHTKATEQLNQKEEILHIDTDIGELLDADEYRTGLKFGIPVLREGIRPLQSGDFLIVAGRPDTGKTSFLASQVSSFIHDAPEGRPIVWFNNEGEGNRIVKRIYQSVLLCTTNDLLERRQKGTLHNEYELATGGKNRILVIDCHGWNTYTVEKALKVYNPALVIFDMIDNITFPGARHDHRTDQILEGMYQWARVLGVKYHFPVIATSQISADAELQADTSCWPAMHMLKDSKTGKQGAADVIVMIGRSNDPTNVNNRYISTPKNKLAVGNSLLRSVVTFDAQRAQYT